MHKTNACNMMSYNGCVFVTKLTLRWVIMWRLSQFLPSCSTISLVKFTTKQLGYYLTLLQEEWHQVMQDLVYVMIINDVHARIAPSV